MVHIALTYTLKSGKWKMANCGVLLGGSLLKGSNYSVPISWLHLGKYFKKSIDFPFVIITTHLFPFNPTWARCVGTALVVMNSQSRRSLRTFHLFLHTQLLWTSYKNLDTVIKWSHPPQIKKTKVINSITFG